MARIVSEREWCQTIQLSHSYRPLFGVRAATVLVEPGSSAVTLTIMGPMPKQGTSRSDRRRRRCWSQSHLVGVDAKRMKTQMPVRWRHGEGAVEELRRTGKIAIDTEE
jgi:hypothetical protein